MKVARGPALFRRWLLDERIPSKILPWILATDASNRGVCGFVTEPSSEIRAGAVSPPRQDLAGKPKPFQFRLRTLFIATVVVAVLLGIVRAFGAALPGLIIVTAIFVLPIGSVVVLARKDGLEFGGWERGMLVVGTGLYSGCMMMLATVAFEPSWKGYKGEHWSYYILDAPAGYTLWPIYWIAVLSFVIAVLNPKYAARSRLNLVMLATLIGISAWYVFAALFLKFCPPLLAYIPGIVCVEYALYARLVVRHGKFSDRGLDFVTFLLAWVMAVLTAVAWKIPLAMEFYDRLPNQSPDCFIVTAASRGHRWFVRSWRDDAGRIVNHQLLTFRRFEATLAARVPGLHRVLRSIYNRFAPMVARRIAFPWLADLVYLLLKPLEWMVVILSRLGCL